MKRRLLAIILMMLMVVPYPFAGKAYAASEAEEVQAYAASEVENATGQSDAAEAEQSDEADADVKTVDLADDSESTEFEVSASVYEQQYKDVPNYEVLGTKTYYRYATRNKSTATSGYDTMSGWTKYNTTTSNSTSGYKFGTPISTSTSYANNKKTVTSAVDTGYYYYAYTAANPNNTSDWAYYAATSRDNVITYMKARFNAGSYAEDRLRYYWRIYSSDQGDKTANVGTNIPHVEDSKVSKGTTTNDGNAFYGIKLYKYSQCYKVKTVTTTNYFYQWTAWSAWSDWTTTRESISDAEAKKEESELRYVIRYNKPAIQLTDCTAEITGPAEFVYDGTEKTLEFTIRNGEAVLEEGKDFVVVDESNRGTDAGSYTAKVSGLGDYIGELTFDFTIAKSEPIFDFDQEKVVKGADAEEFINNLHVQTDGELSFSSENEEVATVNNDGRVTITGKGTTRISVSATEGQNYLTGSSSYTLVVSKNLYDCTVSLSGPSSFTYNGEQKKLSFSVFDGEYRLIENVDYTVSNNSASDVGTYKVLIEGKGEYVGEKELELAVNKATPVLSFASAAVTKRTGADPFINELSSKTDGKITYSTSDTSVAAVDDDGRVTALSPGTVTVSAVASDGTNYKQGRASYSLTVTDASQLATIDELSYSFNNHWDSFGYDKKYVIPSYIYRKIFGQVFGNYQFKKHKETPWGGSCAGFSGTSALLYDKNNDINVGTFSQTAKLISDLKVGDKSSDDFTVREFIEAMQISQYSTEFKNAEQKYLVANSQISSKRKNLNTIYNTVAEQTDAAVPVLVAVRCHPYGHALLAYKTETNGNIAKIYVYDSNHPNEERYIEFKADSSGNWTQWSYNMEGSLGIWGTSRSTDCSITIVPYGVLKYIWDNQGDIQKSYNVLSANSKHLSIYDVDGNLVGKVTDGELEGAAEDTNIIVHPCDLAVYEEYTDEVTLSVPVDIYTIRNDDETIDSFELSMVNSDLGSTIATSASEVTLVAADEYGINEVYIDAAQDDTYSVTLSYASGDSDDSGEIVVEGKGSNEMMQIAQTADGVNVENCQVDVLSSAGQDVQKYQIRAISMVHGSVTPEGTTDVIKGTDRVYNFIPDPGYEVQEVLIDGESVGAVDSYTFKNVSDNHDVIVSFEANSSAGEGKSKNSIEAKDIVKNTSSKVQTFNLNAESVGIADLTYKSNSSKVKVDKNGKVTVAKNFIGKAVITVTAAENDLFRQSTAKVTVTVRPASVKSLKVKSQAGKKAKVTWKKGSGITGYQIQYSTAKNFKGAKIVKVKGVRKVSGIVKKLKAGKTYYFRIRSYKTDSSGTVYSAWSSAKRIKAKK